VDAGWLAVLVEAGADAIAVIDREGLLRYANPAAERLFGYESAEWQGRSVLDIVHPEDLELVANSMVTMQDKTVPGDPIEVRVLSGDGRWCLVEVVGVNLLDDERLSGLVLSIRDITDRRIAERGRASAERVLDHTFAHNPVGMSLCTLDGRFVKVNPAFCELVGMTEAELLNDSYQTLTDPREFAAEADQLAAVVRGHQPSFTTDKRIARRDGTVRMGELTVSMVEDPDGVRLFFGQIRDVTDQRELQRQLEHRSLHDPLTGLANRTLFSDRVRVSHHRNRRHSKGISVAFIDLDDFKTVNDALGHPAGDELLRAVAERLVRRFRATDTVARVGGDEFAVLLDESGSLADNERLAAEIVDLFDEPFEVDGRRFRIGASVGIAPVPAALTDPRGVDELVADADLAMYAAKQAGKGRWRAFQPSMRSRAASRLAIREQLETGLRAEAVEVHYQPVVDTATGQTKALEALARWRHPELGLLRPGDFLDVAQEMGLGAELDWCVLERVAADRQRWRTEAPAMLDLPISVNITVADIGPVLEDRVRAFQTSPGGEGMTLVLELTEQTMLLNADVVTATLARLQAVGVILALDDFGVGYSSLAHLHRLPIQIVKLDRAFLASVQTAGADFMAAVVDLCETLELCVVAEGVETFEQHELVRSVGIPSAQGFFYAEPRGANAITDVVGEVETYPAPPVQDPSTSGAVGPSR
jgi:diguanylate cyclase (GGDEF)-like protein/PAS domain S-box-containing protein